MDRLLWQVLRMSTGSGRFGRVVLRPHRESDVDLDRAEFQGPDSWGEFEWFGYNDPAGLQRAFATDGLLGDVSRLVIESDGAWAGRVTWWNAHSRESPIWRIAVIVRPSVRGTGVGTDAHQALVDYLFAHTGAQRIEAFTDVENVAEQRVLLKSGFAQEGRIRSSMWRQGSWRDQLLYSVLRSDVS